MAALSAAYDPAAALTATAVLGIAGTVTVALCPPSRRWRPTPSTHAHALESPRLASTALVLLFSSLTGVGFAIGAMNVWSVSMAEQHQQDMLSGILPAAFSTGSFLGGLLYGRRHWTSTTTCRLIIATGAFLAGWLPLLFLPGPYAATVAVAVPGAFLTVVVACAYVTTRHPRTRGTHQRGIRLADPVHRRRAGRRHRAGRSTRRAAPGRRRATRRRRSLRARPAAHRGPIFTPSNTPPLSHRR